MLDHYEQGEANNGDFNNWNDRSLGSIHSPLLKLLNLLVEDTHLFHEDNKCERDSSHGQKTLVM